MPGATTILGLFPIGIRSQFADGFTEHRVCQEKCCSVFHNDASHIQQFLIRTCGCSSLFLCVKIDKLFAVRDAKDVVQSIHGGSHMEKALSNNYSFSFLKCNPRIASNPLLREPQRFACEAIAEHFGRTSEPALVQIPVGCGKTGLISLLPFALGYRRALIVAPNLTIREALFDAVDSASPNCFWRNMRIAPAKPYGPFAAKLDGTDVNLSDMTESQFVVTNVQQIGQSNSKWLAQFPKDFFDMILLDEGHHNAAASWKRLIDHFPGARVISLTATPFRSDGQKVIGNLVYRYPFLRAMSRGYIKTLSAVHVQPRELAFTIGDDPQEVALEEVLKLREETWFSRGVALADECNRHIVKSSIEQCLRLRREGQSHHQIIAAACSVQHAERITQLYREAGFHAMEIHSEQSKTRRKHVLQQLRTGKTDAIVQVQILGEGFDHPPLSVAAIFRPFRTLSPYIQFVGRIMRVMKQQAPGNVDNRGVVVSHVGMNTERHWAQFRELDTEDQSLWSGLASADVPDRPVSPNASEELPGEKRFAPEMLVNWEIADELQASQYGEIAEVTSGAEDSGISAEEVRLASTRIVGPQQRRREARSQLKVRVDDAIRQVLRECRIGATGMHVGRAIPQLRRMNNWSAIRFWCYGEMNRQLKRRPGTVQKWSLEEIELGIDLLPRITTELCERITTGSRRRKQYTRGSFGNTCASRHCVY